MLEAMAAVEDVVSNIVHGLRKNDALEVCGISERLSRQCLHSREVLQFIERGDVGVALEVVTECCHGGSLLATDLAIAVAVHVCNADGLHSGVFELDEVIGLIEDNGISGRFLIDFQPILVIVPFFETRSDVDTIFVDMECFVCFCMNPQGQVLLQLIKGNGFTGDSVFKVNFIIRVIPEYPRIVVATSMANEVERDGVTGAAPLVGDIGGGLELVVVSVAETTAGNT